MNGLVGNSIGMEFEIDIEISKILKFINNMRIKQNCKIMPIKIYKFWLVITSIPVVHVSNNLESIILNKC